MKPLRQTCAVAVLTLLLSASTLAGQINCPGVVSEPPPPPTEATTTTDSITTSVILALVSLIS